MKRKAFLIGAPFVEGQPNYLAGVTPDIVGMRNHLMSNAGGAWENEEIQTFENPTRKELLNEIKGNFDFVIIQYSGHGFEYKETGTQLDINPNEIISLDEIHRNIYSTRMYYFLDCCRGIQLLVEKAVDFSSQEIYESIINKKYYRKRYEDIIESCEEGISVIYSCGMNESADEDPKGKGGVFTVCYLSSARSHMPVPKEKYIGIKTVYDEACRMKKLKYPLNDQNPVMKPERRKNYFPFVI